VGYYASWRLLMFFAVFSFLVPCEAKSMVPEIMISGDRTQKFGILQEPYSDPGYRCDNPWECYSGKEHLLGKRRFGGSDCPKGRVPVHVEGEVDLTKYVDWRIALQDFDIILLFSGKELTRLNIAARMREACQQHLSCAQ
jgi:hypothetical protein